MGKRKGGGRTAKAPTKAPIPNIRKEKDAQKTGKPSGSKSLSQSIQTRHLTDKKPEAILGGKTKKSLVSNASASKKKKELEPTQKLLTLLQKKRAAEGWDSEESEEEMCDPYLPAVPPKKAKTKSVATPSEKRRKNSTTPDVILLESDVSVALDDLSPPKKAKTLTLGPKAKTTEPPAIKSTPLISGASSHPQKSQIGTTAPDNRHILPPNLSWEAAVDKVCGVVKSGLVGVLNAEALDNLQDIQVQENAGPMDTASCLQRCEKSVAVLCDLVRGKGLGVATVTMPVTKLLNLLDVLLTKRPAPGLESAGVLEVVHKSAAGLGTAMVEAMGTNLRPYANRLFNAFAHTLLSHTQENTEEIKSYETKMALYGVLGTIVEVLGPLPSFRRLWPSLQGHIAISNQPIPAKEIQAPAPEQMRSRKKKKRREREESGGGALQSLPSQTLALLEAKASLAVAALRFLSSALRGGLVSEGWEEKAQRAVCQFSLSAFSSTSTHIAAYFPSTRLALLRTLTLFCASAAPALPPPILIGKEVAGLAMMDSVAEVQSCGRELSILLCALVRPRNTLRPPPIAPEPDGTLEELLHMKRRRPQTDKPNQESSYELDSSYADSPLVTGSKSKSASFGPNSSSLGTWPAAAKAKTSSSNEENEDFNVFEHLAQSKDMRTSSGQPSVITDVNIDSSDDDCIMLDETVEQTAKTSMPEKAQMLEETLTVPAVSEQSSPDEAENPTAPSPLIFEDRHPHNYHPEHSPQKEAEVVRKEGENTELDVEGVENDPSLHPNNLIVNKSTEPGEEQGETRVIEKSGSKSPDKPQREVRAEVEALLDSLAAKTETRIDEVGIDALLAHFVPQ